MSRSSSILVIGVGHPWVMGGGAQLRFLTVLRTLTNVGRVTYIGIGPDASPAPAVPADLNLDRCVGINVALGGQRKGWRRVSARLFEEFGVRSSPFGQRQVAQHLSDLLDVEDFDLAWLMTGGIYDLTRRGLRGHHALQVVDLMDWPGEWPGGERFQWKGLARRETRSEALRRLRLARRLRLRERHARHIARRTDAVVACKAPPTPPPNLAVVVNSYPARPFTGVRPVSWPPTLLFQGTFGHGPNADAARYLAHEIVPALRDELPEGFSIRLVGLHGEAIRDLEVAVPEVSVIGYVDDIFAELERADLCVSPMRQGTGTRIKILEAWSCQVPAVSTTIGADGLGATDGLQILIADDPVAFARSCRRALSDERLRTRLVVEGHRLLTSRYQADEVSTQVHAVLASVGGPWKPSAANP